MAESLKYEIDLVGVFNEAYADKSQKIRTQIRPLLNDIGVKAQIAELVIDKIVSRTRSGIDKENAQFTKYSEAYKKSIAFKIAGKRGNIPNLTLTGEMLASMVNRSPSSRKKVRIEFADDEQNDKASGHVNGDGNLPTRDFFGLPPDVETSIVRQVLNQASRDNVLGVFDIGVGVDVGVGRQSVTIPASTNIVVGG